MPNLICLSQKTKNSLYEDIDEMSNLDEDERDGLKKFISKTTICENGEEVKIGKGRGGGGAKRAPSAYNLFMGSCVKTKNKNDPITKRFTECALDYKKQKK